MKDYTKKDYILHFLSENNSKSIGEYCKNINADYNEICSLVDDLIHLELVDIIPISSKHGNRHDKLLTINHRGLFFLKNGGFTSTKKAETRKHRLSIAKEIMTYTSTFAIIIISYFNYTATDKANDNKEVTKKLNFTIDSLKKSNDILNTKLHYYELNKKNN
nr:hypothetical protein [uncultured Pedobacter sp.]